jgi:hypothetical protein
VIDSEAPTFPMGRRKCDTPYSLLDSALTAMTAVDPDPTVIVIPGDFVGHYIRREVGPEGIPQTFAKVL